MTGVDALLFDLDGTLIDPEEDLAGSVRALQQAVYLAGGTAFGNGDQSVDRHLAIEFSFDTDL